MPREDPTDRPVRIASIPPHHPYVDTVHPTRAGAMTVVETAPPLGSAPGHWWPPVALNPEWIRTHRDRLDVLHLHFGTESFSTAHLRAVVAELDDAGVPLVYTVHDLENPQLADQTRHREHLDVLVPAAAALLTLTPGAAAEIERRWGRHAQVVPHPHLHPLDADIPLGLPSTSIVVGTHLRDLRPSIDGPSTVRALADALDLLRRDGIDAVGRVHLRNSVRDEGDAREIERIVAESPAALDLIRGDRATDAELAEQLADLDVSVLPYAFGTHSGWAELCFDLGVPVAGAPIGYVSEQHPEDFAPAASGDGESLAGAIRTLVADRATRPGTAARALLVEQRRERRRAERDEVGECHEHVYRSVQRVGAPA